MFTSTLSPTFFFPSKFLQMSSVPVSLPTQKIHEDGVFTEKHRWLALNSLGCEKRCWRLPLIPAWVSWRCGKFRGTLKNPWEVRDEKTPGRLEDSQKKPPVFGWIFVPRFLLLPKFRVCRGFFGPKRRGSFWRVPGVISPMVECEQSIVVTSLFLLSSGYKKWSKILIYIVSLADFCVSNQALSTSCCPELWECQDSARSAARS